MEKIIFMGTPNFSLGALDAIYKAGYDIVLGVSQPDKPSGRNLKILPTPVKEYCVEHNIPVMQPESVKNNVEFVNYLKELEADYIVTAAYGKILPAEILSLPKKACVNVHASLLPKYRGAAPMQWAIINGEKETGITTMIMDVGMDTGDMLLYEKVIIEENDTYGTIYEKLKELGGEVLLNTLKDFDNIMPIKQSSAFTMAPMIKKEDGLIDFSKDAISICNLIRGLNPMPGAYFILNDKKYKVWKAEAISNNSNKNSGEVIVSNEKEGLQIQTGDGVLNIKIIQAPNSKKMNIKDYLRGNKI